LDDDDDDDGEKFFGKSKIKNHQTK